MDIHTLRKALDTPRKIVIIPHLKPDGDAMGSSLGLYHFLIQLNHLVTVITPTDYPAFLKWMPGKKTVEIYPFKKPKCERLIRDAEFIFCLDFNDISRIEPLDKIVGDATGTKIMIDHHTNPVPFEDIQYCDVTASSTCELIFRLLFDEWKEEKYMNQDIAACLYTGIMTDTGSFRFNSTTPDVHRIASRLMETGIAAHTIHEKVYDNFSENRLKLLGYCLLNCLRVVPEKQAAYFVIPKWVTEEYSMEAGDTEGIVNYALSIKGIRFATLMLEDEDRVKLSFRGKEGYVVNVFARNFQGGGHIYASGGKSFLSLAETEQKFLTLLHQTE
ncbi:MAG: bifunctional oligoribonuclease/PAP phosphatase NrnA [Bacteroidia bacterium]|nr:bifunctional oligoribonuclease/PAP phosphatase NrnA [Bacteroidia bacterium]